MNLKKGQRQDIDKIYLYVKDSFESNNCLLIKKVGIEHLNNQKALIDYLQTIDDVCENLENYNPTEKMRVLIVLVFDDMIQI